MEASFYLSVCALLVSLFSVVWSIHIGRRDRGKIEANSELSRSIGGVLCIEVKAVNRGRRPIILTKLWTDVQGGQSFGTYLKDEVLRLDENEQFKIEIPPGDKYTMSQKGERAIAFWLEDTLGRRYRVKNAKKNLKALWESYTPKEVRKGRWLRPVSRPEPDIKDSSEAGPTTDKAGSP